MTNAATLWRIAIAAVAILGSVSPFAGAEQLGLFAHAQAGTASLAGVDAINTAFADFIDGILWNGITALTHDGVAVDFSLNTTSGVDWRGPVAVPLPASGWLLLPAVAWMGG